MSAWPRTSQIYVLPGPQDFIRENRVPVRKDDIQMPGHLFTLVLDREFCRKDPNWRHRPDGSPHDSVKPLDAHGFDPSRTMLVDDSLRKILPHEHANAVILPAYTAAEDPSLASEPHDAMLPMRAAHAHEGPPAAPRKAPVLRALVALLLAHVAGCDGDIRPGLRLVREGLQQVCAVIGRMRAVGAMHAGRRDASAISHRLGA